MKITVVESETETNNAAVTKPGNEGDKIQEFADSSHCETNSNNFYHDTVTDGGNFPQQCSVTENSEILYSTSSELEETPMD